MTTNILIVDDEQKIRQLIIKMLKGSEYHFSEASSAEEARELLKKRPVELILCDIILPGESGLDFSRFVRSAYTQTAVVIITGQDDSESAKTALEIGVFDYITKPFEQEKVLFSVANALQRRELRIANQSYRKNLEKMVSKRTAKLQENEQKFRLLINNIPGFIYKGYKDWSVDFIDNKVCEFTGHDKKHFDNRTLKWSDIIFYEDLERASQVVRQALKEDNTYIREYRVKTKAGEALWIKDRGQVIRKENGDIEYFTGVFFDINEQKIAQEQVRQQERYYRSILSHMHENIAVIDRDYTLVDANAAFLSNVGCSRKEAIGRHCYEVSHGYNEPCSQQGEDCKLVEVFETGRTGHCLHQHSGKNGSKAWMDIGISPLKDHHNRITHVIEAARDVTKQKQVENALRESNERHRTIMETCADPIAVYDVQGCVTYINPAFNRVFGWTTEKLLGKRIDFVPESELAETQKAIQKVYQNGRLSGFETRRYTKSGHTIDVRLGAAVLRDANAAPVGMVVNFQDVTEERKKAEKIGSLNKNLIEKTSQIESKNRQLEQTLKQLKDTKSQIMQSEKMASIGQLAAGVAHEINNPTGFVSSNLKTLFDYIEDISGLSKEYRKLVAHLKINSDTCGTLPDVSEQVKRIMAIEEEIDLDFVLKDIFELVDESKEGTERIKKIVQDLKDFAHPGEDKPKFADINQNMESTVSVVWNELKYKADVGKDYGDLPQVKCYPQLLNQVFVNLLVNAAQSIEDHGEINIKTRADNGYVKIEISDTGSGIPKEKLPSIFDPFFTTKEVGKGTGLGLNVAYNIIQKHHGEIDVKSDVGKGTTFTIRIPVE